MKLVDEQNDFLMDVASLILKADEMGYKVTAGELFRTPEQQKIYVETGRSKTFNSMHLKRLAIDLNIFKDEKLCTVKEIEPLGEFWESLNEKNRWGGRFKTLKDGPHFERKV